MRQVVDGWVEEAAYQMLGGRRLLLRLPPRVGKTFLTMRLKEALGESAFIVNGADFTEENQARQREELDQRVVESIDRHGSAQLIFDSYDRALARSQGARLQAWLVNRLIDGSNAQDLGALFTARCSTQVHKNGAGSPLMSRFIPIVPPLMASGADDTEAATPIREWFGDGAMLAAQASAEGGFNPVAVADRFENDLTYLEDTRRALGDSLNAGRVDPARAPYASRCASYGLMTEAGVTRFYDRLQTLLTASPVDDPVWPGQLSDSVGKFCRLVTGATEVIWVDRYMYRDIEPLRAFLRQVTSNVECKVLLLGGKEVSGRAISRAEMLRLTSVPRVEARFMTAVDFRDLHDRHLATGSGGWVLPQVHVIVARQPPGSTVVAQTATFGVNYRSIWSRSISP